MATRRPNWRAVKMHRNYSVDEAARALGVTKGTMRRWLKLGLPATADRKPILILGGDLIAFLARRRTDKQRCKLDECYCFSCRAPQRAAFDEAEFFPLTSTSGNLRALCSICGNLMHKRVSTARLPFLQTILQVAIREARTALNSG